VRLASSQEGLNSGVLILQKIGVHSANSLVPVSCRHFHGKKKDLGDFRNQHFFQYWML
jgi:hypothetical protein